MNSKKFQIVSNAVSWAGSNGLTFIASEPHKEKSDNSKQVVQISEGSNLSFKFKKKPSNSFQICSNIQSSGNNMSFVQNKKPSSYNNMQISSTSENYNANLNPSSHQGISFQELKDKVHKITKYQIQIIIQTLIQDKG